MNAFKELSKVLSGLGDLEVRCITIAFMNEDINLKEGYSESDLKVFLDKLNSIEYDNGFGGQELYGTVWFTNGTWLSRGEYDGSEWWEFNKYPDIPKELKSEQELSIKICG